MQRPMLHWMPRVKGRIKRCPIRVLTYNDFALLKKSRQYQCLTEPQPAAKAAGAVLNLILVESAP
jgi:hypothetical protein